MTNHSTQTLVPISITDLVAFWDFQEEATQLHTSRGPHSSKLEAHGAVERVEGGVFGPYAARFCGEGFLRAPRDRAPELCIGGAGAAVSVVAWLKREQRADAGGCCEFVAGVWNEHSRRQYALFLDLRIHDSFQQLGAHVSHTGGPSKGFKYCMEAAIGARAAPFQSWVCAAMTYDGFQACAYLDGQLDERKGRNPFPYGGALFDGGPKGADFYVGATPRPRHIDDDGTEHGSVVANPFFGVLGGLAIYRRALSIHELRLLSEISTQISKKQP